jgi:hypothetical protein
MQYTCQKFEWIVRLRHTESNRVAFYMPPLSVPRFSYLEEVLVLSKNYNTELHIILAKSDYSAAKK